MILALIGIVAIAATPDIEMPQVLRIPVDDLPLGTVGRAINERLLKGDRPGAFELLWPQLSEPGKEAARLLAIEIARDVSKARRQALLARWRKESGWKVSDWNPAWKRADLALAYYLLARRLVPEGGKHVSDPTSIFGTGTAEWNHYKVVKRLADDSRPGGFWPGVANVGLVLELGDNLGEARDEAERLIKRYPKEPLAYMVGRAVWSRGTLSKTPGQTHPPNAQRALAYVRKAMELGPNLATPPFLLGWDCLEKDPKMAEAYFRKFVAIQRKAGRSVERERAALAKRGFRLPE